MSGGEMNLEGLSGPKSQDIFQTKELGFYSCRK